MLLSGGKPGVASSRKVASTKVATARSGKPLSSAGKPSSKAAVSSSGNHQTNKLQQSSSRGKSGTYQKANTA